MPNAGHDSASIDMQHPSLSMEELVADMCEMARGMGSTLFGAMYSRDGGAWYCIQSPCALDRRTLTRQEVRCSSSFSGADALVIHRMADAYPFTGTSSADQAANLSRSPRL